MSETLLSHLQAKWPAVTARDSLDCEAFTIPVDHLAAAAKFLRDEMKFDLLLDVTAVDWDKESPRFTVVYHLGTTTGPDYIRLAADCPDDESPTAPSLTGLWPAANWHERETYDMFGIRFNGHPDLRRILMWDDYPHYPLRKDFPLAGIETPLPDFEIGEKTGADLQPAPMAGGPFVSAGSGRSSQDEPRAKDQSWTEAKPKPN